MAQLSIHFVLSSKISATVAVTSIIFSYAHACVSSQECVLMHIAFLSHISNSQLTNFECSRMSKQRNYLKVDQICLVLKQMLTTFSFSKEKIVVYFVGIHVFYSTSRILNILIIKLVIFISCDIYSSYIRMTAGTLREIAETDHMSNDQMNYFTQRK